eukprot:TRINITY_DN1011_c0_g2_i1.p1 TRINITY_DN1011_c0_g2~~TRINITY_DN1011_c0_g2_i1.p1  ORF type:complete len:220 (+),score=41.75 TRINITY_DN1011_c0_g2_i1:31-660(+)
MAHEHNSWEVVRSRKENTTVRCRECQYQVKMKDVRRCEDFSATGRCGKAGCRRMHVYQQKMSLKERVKKHGTEILDKVPARLRKGLDKKGAAAKGDMPPMLLDPDEEPEDEDTTAAANETSGPVLPPFFGAQFPPHPQPLQIIDLGPNTAPLLDNAVIFHLPANSVPPGTTAPPPLLAYGAEAPVLYMPVGTIPGMPHLKLPQAMAHPL